MSVTKPDPKRVARRKMMASVSKTAGEVRFIKDKSNDASQWAWNDSGPQERRIHPDYAFDPRKAKQLAKVLRATTASMGHAMSAYSKFSKLKSADVSPDGNLGGKGYIQKIAEMRRAYMNVIEALSALTDTIYDEVRAPHWAAISRQEDDEDRAEVEQIVQDAEEIKEDPEAWADEEEEEMDEAHGKTASSPPKIPRDVEQSASKEFKAFWRAIGRKKPNHGAVGDAYDQIDIKVREEWDGHPSERGAIESIAKLYDWMKEEYGRKTGLDWFTGRPIKTARSKFPLVQREVLQRGDHPLVWKYIEKTIQGPSYPGDEVHKVLLKIVTEMEKRLGSGKKRTRAEMKVLGYLSQLYYKKSGLQNIRSMANLLKIPVPDSLWPDYSRSASKLADRYMRGDTHE